MKSTRAETESRVGAVIGMLLDGYSRDAIVQYGAEKWQLKVRMMDKYIAKANKSITARAKDDRESTVDWHLQSRKRLLVRAVNEKDYRLVKDTLRDLAELQGMYPKKQLEIETKVVPVTKEQLMSELAKFALKAGLTLEEYCHREGIELDQFDEVTDEPAISDSK